MTPPHHSDPEDIRTAAADEFFTVVRWLFSVVGGGAVAVTVLIELAAGRGAFSLWLQPGGPRGGGGRGLAASAAAAGNPSSSAPACWPAAWSPCSATALRPETRW